MPRKSSAPTPPALTTEQKLDLVVEYLRRIDRRDHWRQIGGFIHGLLALVPMALVLWSAWYFYAHSEEFIRQITEQSMKSMTGGGQDGMMEWIEKYMPKN